MRTYRHVATGLSLALVLGFSIGRGQDRSPGRRALDPKTVSVRLLLGVGDPEEQTWSGKATLDQGEVVDLEGWRFRQGDRIQGNNAWESASHATTAGKKAAAKNKKGAAKKKQGQKAAAKKKGAVRKAPGATKAGGGRRRSRGHRPQRRDRDREGTRGARRSPSRPREATSRSRSADLAGRHDPPVPRRPGRGPGRPPQRRLFDGADQDDFPAAAADGQGGAWVAFVVHQAARPGDPRAASRAAQDRFADYDAEGGGDQVRLFRFADGQAGDPIDVTGAGPATSGGRRSPSTGDGNGGRRLVREQGRELGPLPPSLRSRPTSRGPSPKRLTTDPGTDTDVVLATAPDGKVWMAWQAWSNGQADILLAAVDDGQLSRVRISEAPGQRVVPRDRDRQGAGRSTSRSTPIRRATTTSCSGSGAPTARSASRSPWPARRSSRPGRAWPSTRRGRAWVAYEERTPRLGQGRREPDRRQGVDPLPLGSRPGPLRRRETACSTPPTRSPGVRRAASTA